VLDVVRGQQLRQLGLDGLKLSKLRINTSITRMVPESTRASSSFAISPVKLLAPAGNSTTR
jgi:hypothetical protein